MHSNRVARIVARTSPFFFCISFSVGRLDFVDVSSPLFDLVETRDVHACAEVD